MKNTEEQKKILETAKKRYATCVSEIKYVHDEFERCLSFISGDQWDELEKRKRKAKKRPMIVENLIYPKALRVVNETKQNMPMPKVKAVDSLDDQDKADVINGVLRSMANSNNGKSALIDGFKYAVYGSLGWVRVLTQYVDEDTDNQEFIFDRIENTLSVIAPIHECRKIDYSDLDYCFIVDKISTEAYKELYDDDPLDWDDKGDIAQWVTEEGAVIAEYFYITKKLREPVEGSTSKRKRYDTTVNWCKLSGGKILSQTTFPGKYIPVVPITGDVINIKGKRHYKSLTAPAIGSQTLLNVARSQEYERLSLVPNSPYIAADGQVSKYQDIWSESNTSMTGVLPYTPVSINGVVVGAPQRTQPISSDSGLLNQIQMSKDGIKDTTGIYDASMGQQGNETSGRAINARAQQGQTATYHFTDNLAIALRHLCQIVVDALPEVFDTERLVRMLGEDMREKIVRINSSTPDENGKIYDMKTGKYDVVMDVGPNYATKQEMTNDLLMDFIQKVPEAGAASADIIAKNLGFAEANALSKRLEKVVNLRFPGMVPPDPKDEEANQDKFTDQDAQELTFEYQKADAERKELQVVVDGLMEKIKEYDLERDKLEQQGEIAAMQAAVDIKLKEMDIGQKQSQDMMKIILAKMNELSNGKENTQSEEMDAPESANNNVSEPMPAARELTTGETDE